MKRLYVSTRGTFSTAHFYNQKEWTAETNQAEFGLCFSEFGHGHNYSLDVTFSVPRAVATKEKQYSEILGTVKSLVAILLQDFDHRHLNFTHPAFTSNERISTTEVLSEVLEASLLKIWKQLSLKPSEWSTVKLLGLQVWETNLLAAATERSLVNFSRSNTTWTTTKIQQQIRLISGECRSLEIAFFDSHHAANPPPMLPSRAAEYLKSVDGQFGNLEGLCCALQQNFKQPILLNTKSDYFLFADSEDVADESVE